MIMACQSRVILTGIGKSGIIGQKIAATFNSTGTASFFLHPVEAMHGDLGIVDQRDVILAISYSGETAELNLLLNSLKNRSVAIIAMTGNMQSTMAKLADAVLIMDDVITFGEVPVLLRSSGAGAACLAMGPSSPGDLPLTQHGRAEVGGNEPVVNPVWNDGRPRIDEGLEAFDGQPLFRETPGDPVGCGPSVHGDDGGDLPRQETVDSGRDGLGIARRGIEIRDIQDLIAGTGGYGRYPKKPTPGNRCLQVQEQGRVISGLRSALTPGGSERSGQLGLFLDEILTAIEGTGGIDDDQMPLGG